MGNTIYTPAQLRDKLNYIRLFCGRLVVKANNAIVAERSAQKSGIHVDAIKDVLKISYDGIEVGIEELLAQLEVVLLTTDILLYPPITKAGSVAGTGSGVGEAAVEFELDSATNEIIATNKFGSTISGLWNPYLCDDIVEITGCADATLNKKYTVFNDGSTNATLGLTTVLGNETSSSIKLRLLERINIPK